MLFGGDKLFLVAEQAYSQSMGYCLITKNKKLIVIDGGNFSEANELSNYIKKNGGVVDSWFITHAHSDHLQAPSEIIMRNEIKIEKIFFNFPPIEWLDSVEPADTIYTANFISVVKNSGLKIITPKKDDKYKIDDIEITIMSNPDIDYKKQIINNTSIVLGVKTSGKSILFLGDIEVEGGHRLIDNYKDLHFDVVQMAHHGQCGTDKLLYEAVKPSICLWNTPVWLWENDNGDGYNSGDWTTLETRKWMDEIGVKMHYISKDGSIEIE